MSFNILSNKTGKVTKFFDERTGKTVKRQDQIFVPEWEQMVPTAPYDEHFIYENPDKTKGAPSFRCTCGSFGIVVPPFGKNRMFVCHHHTTYGFHTTSMVNKKDVERGNTKIFKGRKWA